MALIPLSLIHISCGLLGLEHVENTQRRNDLRFSDIIDEVAEIILTTDKLYLTQGETFHQRERERRDVTNLLRSPNSAPNNIYSTFHRTFYKLP